MTRQETGRKESRIQARALNKFCFALGLLYLCKAVASQRHLGTLCPLLRATRWRRGCYAGLGKGYACFI